MTLFTVRDQPFAKGAVVLHISQENNSVYATVSYLHTHTRACACACLIMIQHFTSYPPLGQLKLQIQTNPKLIIASHLGFLVPVFIQNAFLSSVLLAFQKHA